jgi:hypothetical protein
MFDLGDLLGVFDAQQNWRIHALVFWSAIAPYRLVPPADKFPVSPALTVLRTGKKVDPWSNLQNGKCDHWFVFQRSRHDRRGTPRE